MPRTRFVRPFCVLILTLALAAPAGAQSLEKPSPVDLLGRWFAQLWQEIGCVIDPNGHCASAQVPAAGAAADIGCMIDPDGRCASAQAAAAVADIGCHLDPNGICAF
jgi:hypothetical protein